MNRKHFSPFLFSLQILLFLLLNWGGDQVVSRLNWPLWLDSVGTVLCAYLYGPFCGAVTGMASNLLGHILYGIPWYYALVSLLIALIVGVAARQRRLDSLLGTLTVSAMLAFSVQVAAYPINLLLNGMSTGNTWGDAVIGFFGERGLPRPVGLFLGELYVELLDKLVILVALFLVIRAVHGIRDRARSVWEKRWNREKHLEENPSVRVPVLLAAAGLGLFPLLLPVLPSGGAARAEAAGNSAPVNYNDYVQTVYSSSNGLPCGEANDIAMTGDGILWIGTYAGLYRYNGREFRWMDSFDSVRNVNCLYVDEEGRLWIGTNDNGLSIMIGDQIVNVIDQDRGLPANAVKSIIRSADGYYYIGTTGSMQVMTLSGGLRQLCVLPEVTYADHVAADGAGHVAAVSSDGTLFLLRQGQILSSRKLPASGPTFRSCVFDPSGDLLAATTGNEICRFRITDECFDLREVKECPGLQNIKRLNFLENGELFICADNGIAYVNRAGVYEPINTNSFNNSIDNMLVDYQGNLWFTSSRLGLLRLAPSDFRDIYTTVGMPSRVVNTVVEWNGVCYFGTDKGMDAVDALGRQQIRNAVTDRFSGIRIRCMIVDRENHLWVCTYGSGLVELTPSGEEFLYNSENGAFGNRARVVKQLSDGSVLAAGDTGLSLIRDHQVEYTIDRSDRHISSMVLTITEMPDGSILVGTDGNGLAIVRGRDVLRMLTRADGLSSEVILRTVPDPRGGGVFVVTSNGLCYLDADETIRRLDNFPYYNNYDIWIRDGEELFVLSSAGIYVVDRASLLSGRADLSVDLLNDRRGLTAGLTANAWTWFSETGGDLYLPCDTGVFVLNPDRLAFGTQIYRMNVAGYRTDGAFHRLEQNSVASIPRSCSRLEILPEVINYSIQDPYVGFMLEGFDSSWTILPQDSLSSIVYTNLPTGNFTFRLAAFDNSQSNILAERTYSFSKRKEMYDSGWFIFYLLFVPMFTVFWVTWLLLKRRERKMQAQLAEAERNVEMGRQTVMAIANAVDAKDPRTSEHSRRVALYSRQIAEACGLDPETCRNIEWTARMHDIGKIGVRDAVLNKAGRLTDEEYGEMKAHTTRGAKILENFTLVSNVIEGAEYHHERYDGKGYPKGLKGEEIPLSARIIGVADAFDAMTANRVYRKQLDFSYVLGELERGKGTQFDPRFVEILLQLIREGQINLNEIYHVSPEDALKAMNQSPGSAAMSSAEAEARARAAAEEDAKAGKTAAAFVPPSGDAPAQAGPADRKKPESPEKTEKSEKPDQGGAGS